MTKDKVFAELDDLFAELDTLLKNPEVGAVLADAGINTSLAMVAADAVKAYLHGDKERASEDFSTVGEEIAARLASRTGWKEKPS